MTPKQFKAARRELDLTQNGMAQALGIASDRTVRRWEAGERDIPGPAIVAIAYMLEFGLMPARRVFWTDAPALRDREGGG